MANLAEQFGNFRSHLENEVARIERTIADMELNYLQSDSSQMGTVLKGFEGFLSTKDVRKRSRTVFKAEDRLFSLSSKTSPVTREMEQSMLDGANEVPQGGGGTFGKKGYAQKGYAQKRAQGQK